MTLFGQEDTFVKQNHEYLIYNTWDVIPFMFSLEKVCQCAKLFVCIYFCFEIAVGLISIAIKLNFSIKKANKFTTLFKDVGFIWVLKGSG